VKQSIDLNGVWSVRGFGEKALNPMPAQVPGNVELDLMANKIIEDPFYDENEKYLRPYEFYDWEYTRQFDVPADFPLDADLEFDGIDCVAEVFLNGEKICDTDNAFVRHTIKVDNKLKRGSKNKLTVLIKSPILSAAAYELDHHDRAQGRNMESLPLRKPAHEFGWDICPRCCLGGIWRDVRIVERPADRMLSCYFDVMKDTRPGYARVYFSYSFATALRSWNMFQVEIEMKCGDSVFKNRWNQYFTSGIIYFDIHNPKLWWPAGYGEPNMYDATVRVFADEKPLFETSTRVGLRSMKFEYDETPESFNARFVVNGVPIMVKGSNWVPADALHSRDKDRIIPILELFSDLNCNMLRVWGGGVYEPKAFYDYCDDHGIMVWQDFMIACAIAPLTDDFRARFAKEVEWVVKELRQHPSIAMWAGDNEVDAMCGWGGAIMKPSVNRLTREVIPQILHRLDPNRPYLPSSPYYSPESEAKNRPSNATPEQHIWGPRDYFKSPFYADNNAVFISETGYHGANSVESIKKFIPADKLWPWRDNSSWEYHAAHGYPYRIGLMFRQVREEFNFEPDNLEDFTIASQIVQAEAKKFFVENVRIHKWKKAGILWWNVMDCWPQFSDAIVDYYFDKKLAYGYLKRAQVQLLGIVGEWKDWGHSVVMANDSLKSFAGKMKVSDGDTGEVLFERDFRLGSNENQHLGRFNLPNCDQRLLLIQWECDDGTKGGNHYITGRTPLDFKRYRDNWLPKIQAL
jgi:beta-mannosidase